MAATKASKYSDLSDEELIEKTLATGGGAFFDELYARYASKVYRKCLSFAKDDMEAHDMAHDVIVKIYLNLNRFNRQSRFSTWVYAITYNHCVDHKAKQTRQQTLRAELSRMSDGGGNDETEDGVLEEIDIDSLKLLMEKLSPAEKSILLMKYQDGLSIREIAEITEAGESAVKMKLKRTRAKLVKMYEQEHKGRR